MTDKKGNAEAYSQRGKTAVEVTSEVKATLIDSMGDDESVVHAARVSIVGARAETESGERTGLLNFLMKNRHASPFEHVTATFMLDIPLFVAREVQRHRTFSYNEVSGRYSILEPKFYTPPIDRPLQQVGKPGAYSFTEGTHNQQSNVQIVLKHAYMYSWDRYQELLNYGIAKEVARDVLPVGIFTAFYMTGNLRNWLSYLSLRTAPDALFEIQEVSRQIEKELWKIAPTCMRVWDSNGRGQV